MGDNTKISLLFLLTLSVAGVFAFSHYRQESRLPSIVERDSWPSQDVMVPEEVAINDPFLKTEASATLHPVANIVDGDTIIVDISGKDETVRLIGVDTPETVHPSKPVQCFGAEASARTKSWLSGRSVTLVTDPSQGERDKYGRLLAYVWRDDGLFVNRSLVSEGFAFEYTYNLPYRYQTEFQAAEASAREGKKGLWADDACAASFGTRGGSSVFVPSNPNDKDCADFDTQTDAQSYFEAGGGSSTYNFDLLDGDHDGVACESLTAVSH